MRYENGEYRTIIRQMRIEQGYHKNLTDKLLEIFQKNFHAGNLSKDSDLFEMGLDSFTVNKVCTEIENSLNISISFAEFIMYATIDQLSVFLTQKSGQKEKKQVKFEASFDLSGV